VGIDEFQNAPNYEGTFKYPHITSVIGINTEVQSVYDDKLCNAESFSQRNDSLLWAQLNNEFANNKEVLLYQNS
jgi:hypothetical protein